MLVINSKERLNYRKFINKIKFVLNKNTDLEKMKKEGEMVLEWK